MDGQKDRQMDGRRRSDGRTDSDRQTDTETLDAVHIAALLMT